MTERSDLFRDRVEIAVDRATRIVRLLTWGAMFALVCLMLWVASGMAARAEDPKAAARAIGNAGNAAARTIARDSSNAADVPGYAGTNPPERRLTASGMEDAARARLADPNDPGGAAGRSLIEGTSSRPAANVPASDPMVVRSEIYLGHAGCAGCKVFGPLLRAFSLRHGLDVLAVSLTGGALEGWPEAVPDNGRAARLGLGGGPGRSPAPVPALVLFDTQTKHVLPVGFGVMAEDEMAERIFALTALEPGHDY